MLIKKSQTNTDLALIWLSQELQTAAERGYVLELSEIWTTYCDIAACSNVLIPTSFQTQRSMLKMKLVPLVGDVMQFVPSLNV